MLCPRDGSTSLAEAVTVTASCGKSSVESTRTKSTTTMSQRNASILEMENKSMEVQAFSMNDDGFKSRGTDDEYA